MDSHPYQFDDLDISRSEDGHVRNVNFDYQDWSTDNGTGKVFFADGTTTKTQMNNPAASNWVSNGKF
jgi:hypothetical protein